MAESVESHRLTDAECLERFTSGGDEAAFEVLLWRHGPMVLQVCRRLLRQEHDAADAFQATFLTLVRKGKAIGKPEAVASWLYKVAYRVALRARAQSARRTQFEQLGLAEHECVADPIEQDLSAVLDLEINRLPARYRVPFVLCYLQGKTNREAAQELDCPEGTVAYRLSWARRRLRDRLTRRGLAVACTGLSLASLTSARAADHSFRVLVDSTLRGLLSLRVNGAPGVSRRALLLSTEVMRMMRLASWKNVAAVLAVLLVLAGGSGLLTGAWLKAEPRSDSPLLHSRFDFPAEALPAEAPREQAVHRAIAKAQAYLKKNQRPVGDWQSTLPPNYREGVTSLVLHGLLESGLDPQDAAVRKGIELLLTIRSEQTYVVALQTLVFCRADPRKYLLPIQKNVDWLLAARVYKQEVFIGWTYGAKGSLADNSNTQYAVRALDAAAQASAKIDRQLWTEIQTFYRRNQAADGGWSYTNDSRVPSSLTMTCAGVSGLLRSGKRLNNKTPDPAVARGMMRLGDESLYGSMQFFRLHDLALVGRLAGKESFTGSKNRPLDWQREGVDFLLSKQKENGSWTDAAGEAQMGGPLISTSLALLFLGKGS